MKDKTKIQRYLYGSLWLLLYFIKWPVLVGVPLLYLFTPYESNLGMNIIWFISMTAVLWDIIVYRITV